MHNFAVTPPGLIHREQPITVSIQRILHSYLDGEEYIYAIFVHLLLIPNSYLL
jgi:hypothetical protein